MIKFREPIEMTFVLGYCNEKYKVGYKALIDKMTAFNHCESNIMCRVINIGKKPVWVDLGWFGKQFGNIILCDDMEERKAV
jgi:hypothetical protein